MVAGLAQQSAVATLFPSSATAKTGEVRKTRKLAFNWKQFRFRAKSFSAVMGEPAAPKTADGAAAANLPSRAIGYRRSKIEPIAGRQQSENSRGWHRYKYGGPKK
jgi:hypothetical protein